MYHFAVDPVDLSAVPLLDRIAVQKIKILMISIDEQGGIRLLDIIIQNILIMHSAVPDPAEIPGDQQIIIFCQRSKRFVQDKLVYIVKSVGVPCNADHYYSSVYYTERPKPSEKQAVFFVLTKINFLHSNFENHQIK